MAKTEQIYASLVSQLWVVSGRSPAKLWTVIGLGGECPHSAKSGRS